MLKNIVTKEEVTFKELENKIFEICMEFGREILSQILNEQAKTIDEARDKSIYRNKGNRKTVIKTKLGEVEYKRPLYLLSKEKQIELGRKSIYLLDKELDINKFGKISSNIVDIIIANIDDLSYRRSAINISTLTGQTISSMAVWNIIQNLGEEIKRQEDKKVELYENDRLSPGEKKVEIIYQESDGVNIVLQGKDRKKKIEAYKKVNPEVVEIPKAVRNKEIKVATTYEGWKKIGKDRYEIIGKEFICGYMSGEKIARIKEAKMHEKYNVETTKIRVINSDGAKWIRETALQNTIYQLDHYHIKDKINRHVLEQEDRQELIKMFLNKQYNEMIEYVEELKYKYGGEIIELEKLEELKTYLINNKDGLKRYHHNQEIRNRLIKLSNKTGLRYRHMGVQESQNYCVLTRRMKRRRMSFSIRGSENLAKVLCFYHSESYQNSSSITQINILPEKLIEQAEEHIRQLEENIKKIKKDRTNTYLGNQVIISDNYPNIRKKLKYKPISELRII